MIWDVALNPLNSKDDSKQFTKKLMVLTWQPTIPYNQFSNLNVIVTMTLAVPPVTKCCVNDLENPVKSVGGSITRELCNF